MDLKRVHDSMTEEQLVKGCVENNASVQKELFDRYSKTMMGICLRYAADSQEAQDIVQEGFIKVFKSISSFSGQGSLEGWIKRIMINSALDSYRKNKKRQTDLEIDELEMDIRQENDIIGELTNEYLLNVLQKLPEGYRQVFNLYAIEGYNHKEIGERLGISENTSKSQYSRAKKFLQKMLKNLEIDGIGERS